MTRAQAMRLYWPAWTAAAKAQGWRMAGGRLVGQHEENLGRPVANDIYQRVWHHAESVAMRAHRAVQPDDLRHGVHVTALGRDCSSKNLSNSELDRVLVALRLLADPDAVSAAVAWEQPLESQKRRRIWWLQHQVKPEYLWRVARDMYEVVDEDGLARLNAHQVETLYGVLRHRPGAMVVAGR